jgi:FkbM family methyltransferase
MKFGSIGAQSSFAKTRYRMRRLAERFSRHVCFDRRLPARFGSLRLRVSPGASLSYYRGMSASHFVDLFDFAERHVQPGHCVWDVGGNMGVFSFAAAARAGLSGRVLCLEPDPWSLRLLRRSCDYNRGHAAPVHVLPLAVNDRLALEWLDIPERSRATTYLHRAGGAGADMTGGVREQCLVPTVTLDWLSQHYAAPQVLKIDVDGAERSVLEGGRTLIQNHQPVILAEVYERNADAVSLCLHELGYTLYDFNAGTSGQQEITRATYNTLALPARR